jgi:hypothetical protein
LELVQEGASKGYLREKIHQPILELLQFAARQDPALKDEIFRGCFKSIRSALGEMKRTKKKSMAIKTVLLKFEKEDDVLPELKSPPEYTVSGGNN